MTSIRTFRDIPLKGKSVLMRVDFNVPLDKQGHITDDSRIRAALPSIRYVLDQGGALILMSHLGRPQGKPDRAFSLKPCADRLSELLGKPVIMAPDCVGAEVKALATNLKPGEILFLENLRFHPEEEKPEKNPDFVRQLAELGDVYVNDAFGTAHRAHASTALIAQYFPGKAVAGFLMEKEIRTLGNLLVNPKRPFYAMIGGAKISTKMGVLNALQSKVDALLIGGGMAYTFFKAQGIEIGDSIHEDQFLSQAHDLLKKSSSIFLPVDILIADSVDASAKTMVIDTFRGIPKGFQGVDIGPKTIKLFQSELQKAKTVFWNGPMGVFEIPAFANGTNAIATTLSQLNAETVVGGGESVAAVEAAGVADKISHISTGGGSALEYIEFGTLPGIKPLIN